MAKKVIRDEILKLEIEIGGNKAQMELGKLEQEAREINEQVKELGREMGKTKDKDSEAYKTMKANRKELNAQLDVNKQKQTLIRKELGLHGLTYRQLGQEAKRLQLLLSNSTYGSEQWKKLDADLRRVKTRMTEVRGGSVQTNSIISKMATGFNKYFTMLGTFALSLTGIIAGIRKAYLAYAEFDDKMADVMKTTGLTKDQVKELNKEFDKIDTRSSQVELNDLARIAGKLGINASEDVLGFVRAADKINVALSEDLGGNAEDAIREIGKLTDIFKLKDTYGMEESLLKVGSAINALGAASTANEAYMVEFTKRLAGVAPNAKISIQDILGLAATLDQLGQSSEVASTVMSQLLPDMFKDTATYAQMAGMKVNDFAQLLETDANDAMIKVLEGLNGNNEGFGAMVQKLDALGLEGKRSISVLGVLANNTNLLRQQQQFSNAEFQKGTSILDEFNTKNTTARAELDKSVKVIQRMWRELGEKLAPAIRGVVSSGTALVRSLTVVVDFFVRYGKIITMTTSAIAGYILGTKGAALYTSLLTKAQAINTTMWGLLKVKIKEAIASLKAFNIATSVNPWGVIVAGIALVVTAFKYRWKPQIEEMIDYQGEFNEQLSTEQGELLGVVSALKAANPGTQTRSELIKQLNEKYGEYLPNLLTEESSLYDIEQAYFAANRQIIRKIALTAQDKQITAITTKQMKVEQSVLKDTADLLGLSIADVNNAFADYSKITKTGEEATSSMIALLEKAGITGEVTMSSMFVSLTNTFGMLRDSQNNVKQSIQGVIDEYAIYIDTADKVEDANKKISKGKGGGVKPKELTEEEKEKREAEAKKQLAELQKQAEDIKKAYESLYQEVAYVEMTDYERSVTLLEKKFEEQLQIIEKARTTMVKGADGKMAPLISTEEATRTIQLIETQYYEKRLEIDQKEYERLISTTAQKKQKEEEYQSQIQRVREQYVERNSGLINYEITLLEEQHTKGLVSTQQYQQRLFELNQQKTNISLQFDKQVAEEQLKQITALHSQKLISTEQFTNESIALSKKINDIQMSMLSVSDFGSTGINEVLIQQLTELNTVYIEKKNQVLMTDEEYRRRHEEITTNSNNLTKQQVTQHLDELNREREQSKEKALTIESEYQAERQRIMSKSGSTGINEVLIQQLTELNTVYIEKKNQVLMTDEEYRRRHEEITTNSNNLTKQQVIQHLDELNREREQSKEKALTIESEYQAERQRIMSKSGSTGINEVLIQQLTELNTVYIEKKNQVLMTDEEYRRRHEEITTNSNNLTKQQVTQYLDELNREREQSKEKALTIESEYQAERKRIISQFTSINTTMEESLFRQLQSIRRMNSEEGMAVLITDLSNLQAEYSKKQSEILMSEEEYSKRKTEIITNSNKLTKQQVTQALEELDTERKNRSDKSLIIEQEYQDERKKIIDKAVQDDAEVKAETDRQEKLLAIRRQYGLLSNAELMKEELDQLEAHYKKLGIKDEEYYKARAEIIKKYSPSYDEKNPTDTSKTGSYSSSSNAGVSLVSGFAEAGEFSAQKSQLAQWYETEKEMLAQQYKDKEGMQEIYLKKIGELDAAHKKFEEDVNDKSLQAQIAGYANMFGTIAGFFEQGSEEWKMFSIFQVTLSTASAAIEAYKAVVGIPYVGPVLAPIAAAAAVAFGLQQISEISNTEPPKMSQYYTGYYDYEVLGDKDGKRHQAKYQGKPETGYVSTPSLYLAGDDPNRLSEMIVSGPDLQNPMIADYARAIMDIKHNRQPIIMQSPAGYSTTSDTTIPKGQKRATESGSGLGTSPEVVALLSRISDQLEKPTRAKVVFSDLEEANQKMDTIRNDVRQ